MILDGCVFKIILWQDEIMFVYARITLSKCFTSKLSKLTDSTLMVTIEKIFLILKCEKINEF